ncbi:Calcium-transporting ATPase [Fasciola hepatica]|uniref:Calcium-transporting ATPase n=1 Tax=Fasciola hepatica TaxID=6192 RepID=A0A4E0RAA0_FASHE|nr:Calcium-transporting ATPase [Fasciola hepatica]
MEDAYSRTAGDILKFYSTSEENGLSDKQVGVLLKEYGYNELPPEESKPLWRLVLEQFDELLVKILLLAATISFVSVTQPCLSFRS